MPEVAYACGNPRAAVLGIGAYIPEQRVTNDDLARIVDTSDEWIRQRTGIAERRLATGMTTAQVATHAARVALERAEVLPSEIDLIVVGTSSPDRPFPSTACDVQRALGATSAMATDTLAACTSWLYAVSIAERYISGGGVKRALVIGAEVISRLIDYEDRRTCVLFGDGAGAAVLGASHASAGFESFVLGADGSRADLIYYGPEGDDERSFVRMNGTETFKIAPRTMETAARRACEVAGVELSDIKVVVPHQANARIVEVLARRLGLPVEMFLANIDRYGNTSSASIPLVLDEAMHDGRINPGDRILLAGFGAGMTWGASVLTCGA